MYINIYILWCTYWWYLIGDHPWSSFWFSNKQHYLSLDDILCILMDTFLCLMSYVLLCFIDPRVRKIRNEASSCPGIFCTTLRVYHVASSPSSPLPHLLDRHRKLVGSSAIPARSCMTMPRPSSVSLGKYRRVGSSSQRVSARPNQSFMFPYR